MTKRQIRRVLVLWEDALYGVITARTILARMKDHLTGPAKPKPPLWCETMALHLLLTRRELLA